MKSSPKQIIRIIVTGVFLVCMLFANFYAVRRIGRLATEVYLYDKLSVAYNLGGNKALEQELKIIFTKDKFPRELSLARKFETELKGLKDPGVFLDGQSAQYKNEIMLLRNLRSAAIVLMFLVFGWRMFVNLRARSRKNKIAAT